MLARQLEEFGVPLLAGGLADQPLGYLADVLKVRSYLRAREAVALQRTVEGEVVNPAPPQAERLLAQVDAAYWQEELDED